MADVLLARVSGNVISVPPARSGFFRSGHARAGEEWVIETVNVLVGDQDVTAVQLPRRTRTGYENLAATSFKKHDEVDFLVEVSVYRETPQAKVLRDYPAEVEENAAA